MLRLIAAVLVSIFAISILRSVIGLIMKAFGDLLGTNLAKTQTPSGRPQPTTQQGPVGGELKKDPVCGTYILAATAVKKSAGGQTHYFCSTDCRDKYSA